jgi:hypothetical protein
MGKRKEFKMSKEQFQKIVEASKPVRYMVFNGSEPMSPQENANHAWQRLGSELGFDYLTVQPVKGKSQEYFTAELKD